MHYGHSNAVPQNKGNQLKLEQKEIPSLSPQIEHEHANFSWVQQTLKSMVRPGCIITCRLNEGKFNSKNLCLKICIGFKYDDSNFHSPRPVSKSELHSSRPFTGSWMEILDKIGCKWMRYDELTESIAYVMNTKGFESMQGTSTQCFLWISD